MPDVGSQLLQLGRVTIKKKMRKKGGKKENPGIHVHRISASSVPVALRQSCTFIPRVINHVIFDYLLLTIFKSERTV